MRENQLLIKFWLFGADSYRIIVSLPGLLLETEI